MPVRFALNHMVAPRKTVGEFFELTRALGLNEVEIRNDLATPLADGTPASAVKDEAIANDLSIISINALQRFNDWNADRQGQAAALIDYAEGCGAKALVLCPVNDVAFRPSTDDRLAGLRQGLTALAPMLRQAGLVGLVEPLGFAECSLRSKREAVEEIDAVGAEDVFKLVHDTFHHHVAGEPALFPDRTGLVHVSGVSDPSVRASVMRDPHRVLVTEDDTLDNIGQIRALMAGGYTGIFSFEPFAESIAQLSDARADLQASMAIVQRGVQKHVA